jgi:hypothetical protein
MTRRSLLLAAAGSAVIVTGALALVPPARPPSEKTASASVSGAATRVYYFHGNYRCSTCRTIEAYAREAVTGAFARDLEARRLEWQVVNVDQAENRHFIKDFQLYTRSLVIVDGKDPRRFKVLERVWELVHDRAGFHEYVAREIRAFTGS